MLYLVEGIAEHPVVRLLAIEKRVYGFSYLLILNLAVEIFDIFSCLNIVNLTSAYGFDAIIPIARRRMLLYSFIVSCGIVNELALLGKARAVAGAIPRVLCAVVFKGTAEVRTPRCAGCEDTHRRFGCVN